MTALDTRNLAAMIDHTYLSVDTYSVEPVDQAIETALSHNVAALCLSPKWVRYAHRKLAGSGIAVCTVAGFPSGIEITKVKAVEAKTAIDDGAYEIDMVMNWRALKDRQLGSVVSDMEAVRAVTEGAILKVIVESAALTDAELATASVLAREVGADFIKTSTGVHEAGGATVHAVEVIAAAAPGIAIKASGGVRTREHAAALVAAGATRIGTSNTAQMLGSAL